MWHHLKLAKILNSLSLIQDECSSSKDEELQKIRCNIGKCTGN